MKVSIEERHIREGEKCKGGRCPIALAIREKYDLEEYDIGVCAEEVIIDFPEASTFYSPDKAAQEFIHRFDKGLTVEPIEIELTRDGEWTGLKGIDYE